MKVDKYKITGALMIFALLGLVLLLVRENEGRVAAETKLNDLKYKTETAAGEKENIIMDLKSTIHDLETQITDKTAKHEAEMAEKAAQVQALNTQLEDQAKKYEGMIQDKNLVITDLETKSKKESGTLNQIIKEKSARLSELGTELEKSSARYSALLKEKESLEAKTISEEADIASLRTDLKKVQREKERLSQTVLAQTKKPELIND